ncbi:MAG: hypothetical protein P8Y22_00675 [Sulfurimonas sp.]
MELTSMQLQEVQMGTGQIQSFGHTLLTEKYHIISTTQVTLH